MAPELPGYYFDAAKNKYFKIEHAHTAPPSASWSAAAVKRRRVALSASETALRRAALLCRHVRRHGAWEGDVVARGLLRREVLGAAAEDLGGAAWAAGLRDKGSVAFAPVRRRGGGGPNMPCLWVGGEEDGMTGLGVAYATLDEETLVGSYIATDDNDAITFGSNAPESTGRLRPEMVRCPQMSSIAYHRPSHKMLLTSREPDRSCGVYLFSPPLSNDDDPPTHYRRLTLQRQDRSSARAWSVHKATPAPASSRALLCVLGTSAGLLRVQLNESLSWLSPPRAPPHHSKHVPEEVFDQDFMHAHPDVLVAGGRAPRLYTADLRIPAVQWRSTPHRSGSITHVRSVAEHQVLVAGLRSTMVAYDVRFWKRPVVRFGGYSNEEHVHTGWDVCEELGVVAAAAGGEDGTVRLFDVRSGRRLARTGGLEGVRGDRPVRALMFARMPREKVPSLWVGEGARLRKFSMGVGELGDEA